jgi:predicted DNA-binding protein with PD1-like motif
MESASMTVGRIHILRVDPGEDVLLSIREFLREAGLQQAVVLGGYGTLVAHHLHWVTHTRLPTDNTFGRSEGGIEILSMNGLVVEGEPHIHVTLSTPGGAYGGHMEEGCRAYVVCEIFFAEIEGRDLTRTRVRVAVPGMGEGDIARLALGNPGGPSHTLDGST